MPRIISPSVLSADFGHLADDIAMLDRSEAEWIHIDVMDGVFVPNISFGFPVMGPIRQGTKKVLDTHLMIVNPEKYVERFVRAGADIVTIHLEATEDVRGAIAMIKKAGAKAGVSIKPKTPVAAVAPYLNELDLVLVMSVEPGFGGQSFIEGSTEKVAEPPGDRPLRLAGRDRDRRRHHARQRGRGVRRRLRGARGREHGVRQRESRSDHSRTVERIAEE